VFCLRVTPAESDALCARGGRRFSYRTLRGTVTVGKMVSAPAELMANEADLTEFVANLSIRGAAPRAR